EGKAKGDAAAGLSVPAAAERAAFQAKNAQNSAYDLLDDVKKGKVKLEEVKKEDLPEELKKLTLKEQKEYLDNLDKKRAELNKQRTEYIAKKQAEAKDKGKESFDNQVLEVLRNQAKKHKIEY